MSLTEREVRAIVAEDFPGPSARKAERRARTFTVEFKCEMHTKF
jgi:hypothetical protein